MNGWEKNDALNLRSIEQALLQSNDFVFESYATFILRSSFKKFQWTRGTKDSGVDGYFKGKGKKQPSEFFSIYAPIKNVVKSHESKLFTDFNKLLTYTSSKGYEFKKWHVVLNFEITEEFYGYLESLCEDHEIELTIYTPRGLMHLITNEEQLFKVKAYILGINRPFNNYSDFHYHVFFEIFIKSLNHYYALTTTEKSMFMRDWEKNVCRYVSDDKKISQDSAFRELMGMKIPAHLNSVYIYLPKENKFLQKCVNDYVTEQGEISFENKIWKNHDGNICVYANNLFLIYGFLKEMAYDLVYNIDSTLKSFMKKQIELYDVSATPLTNVW
ncbi:hypothetical protein [Lysinibacillus sp. NPDC056232]|uniref:hypothetical protein n=1 Tax=Lysinibacillus sp. NPDC056232 TaxID=3345756 RepID=UPI0035DF7690